jgi:hypothetical protein
MNSYNDPVKACACQSIGLSTHVHDKLSRDQVMDSQVQSGNGGESFLGKTLNSETTITFDIAFLKLKSGRIKLNR